MITEIQLLSLLQFGVNNIVIGIGIFDNIYIATYSILDFFLVFGYMRVSFNFLKRVLDKKGV